MHATTAWLLQANAILRVPQQWPQIRAAMVIRYSCFRWIFLCSCCSSHWLWNYSPAQYAPNLIKPEVSVWSCRSGLGVYCGRSMKLAPFHSIAKAGDILASLKGNGNVVAGRAHCGGEANQPSEECAANGDNLGSKTEAANQS